LGNVSGIAPSIPAIAPSRASFSIAFVHDEQRLAAFFLEGHRGDGTIVTFVVGPDQRACGVTSMYLPKKPWAFEDASWPNSKRYLLRHRTSALAGKQRHAHRLRAHHRLSSSGLVHASNTVRARAVEDRVTTAHARTSVPPSWRFFIGAGSLSLVASIDLLLPFQWRDRHAGTGAASVSAVAAGIA